MSDKQITHAKAKIADLCDECAAPIWPGNAIVVYVERYVTRRGQEAFVTRHYCGDCGKLLEDSLTTTEAI